MPSIQTIHVPLLDISVTPVTANDVASWMLQRKGKAAAVVLGHNLHSVYLYHSHQKMQEIYDQADLIVIDGFPILAAVRMDRSTPGLSSEYRVGSTDWIPQIIIQPDLMRLAVIGASEQSNNDFVSWVRRHAHPKLEVLGFHGESWDESRATQAVNEIRSFEPQITLVGLGMPKQEEFLLEVLDELPPGVYALVGGAIDQLAGHQRNAPRWLGRYGLEWLWRLLTQPKRMWSRYMVEPWKLLSLLMRRKFDSLAKK